MAGCEITTVSSGEIAEAIHKGRENIMLAEIVERLESQALQGGNQAANWIHNSVAQ